MTLQFKLEDPVIEVMPTRNGYLHLNIENVPGLTTNIIQEITEKLGFEAIFKSFCEKELLELQAELNEYISTQIL